MAEQKSGSGGRVTPGLWIAGAAVGLLVILGLALLLPKMTPTQRAAPETTASVASAPEVTTTAAPAVPAPAVQPDPPSFDTVRAEQDGTVLVAGQAPAGSTLTILVDDKSAGTGALDAQGKFAAMLDLGPSDQPRVLRLSAALSDGTALASRSSVILAPTPKAAKPEVLVADDQGVTKETETPPPVELVIDTVGYDARGNVDLSGRGAAGAQARLYVDNGFVAMAPMAADGKWRAKLTAIATGTHTLRVDQTDVDGKVTARAEATFTREEPAAPAAATATADEPAPAAAPVTSAKIVKIEKGSTLWAIAKATYGDGLMYVRVYEANKDQIRDPDLIYPGQVFTLPQE